MTTLSLDRPIRHLKQLDFDGVGDCMRTCLAMLLGCEQADDFPHFAALEGPGSGWDKAETWLRERGFSLIHFPIRAGDAGQLIDRLQHLLDDVSGIVLGGHTYKFGGHYVVVTKDCVFDPGYDEGQPHCIALPFAQGEYWAATIVPLRRSA